MRRPIVAVAAAVVILAAATTGGLLLVACGGSSGSASTTQTAATDGSGGQPPDMSSMFGTALDPLVEAGTITSDQETTVIDALTSSMPSGGQGGQGGRPSPGATPPTGQMPSSGATPPSGAQQGSAPDASQMFSSTLDGLVSDGTITSAQETAVSEALSSAMQNAGPGGQQQTSASSTQSS
jgi:hypothetical protein